MNRGRNLHAPLLLVGILLIGTSGTAGADPAPLVRMEAEHFIASESQIPIEAVWCEMASNDTTIIYMDHTGDWLLLRFEMPFQALIGFEIASASLPDTHRHWRTAFYRTGEETPLFEEVLITRPGGGMG